MKGLLLVECRDGGRAGGGFIESFQGGGRVQRGGKERGRGRGTAGSRRGGAGGEEEGVRKRGRKVIVGEESGRWQLVGE